MSLVRKLQWSIFLLWKASPTPFTVTGDYPEVFYILMRLKLRAYQFSPIYVSLVHTETNRTNSVLSLNQQRRIDLHSTPWLFYLGRNWNQSFFIRHMASGWGTKTFFQDILNWPEMDYPIQCDVVKCFDRIRHDLLLPQGMFRAGK